MPKKFFRRKDKFLAVRFSLSRYDEIRKLTQGRVYRSEGQYRLYTDRHEFILREGDYITEKNGEFEVWSADVFESLFEVVPGQDDNEGGEA